MQKLAKPHFKKLLLALVGLVAIVGLGVGLFSWRKHKSMSTSEPNNAGNTNARATNTIDYSPASTSDNTESESRKTTAPDTTQNTTSNNTTANFKAQIVSANVNNNNVHVGTLVDGITSGNCTLTASQAGQPNLDLGSTAVVSDVGSYSCGAFNIAVSKFPNTKVWKLTLTVIAPSGQVSDSLDVTPVNGG